MLAGKGPKEDNVKRLLKIKTLPDFKKGKE